MPILTPVPRGYPVLWFLRLQAFTRLSATMLSSIFCLALLMLFWGCGAFSSTLAEPWGESARLQVLGLVLFYSIIAPYMLGFMIYSIRLSEKTLDSLREHLDYDDEQHAQWRNSFSQHPQGLLILFGFVGALIALPVSGTALFHLNLLNIGIVLGNVIVWVLALQATFILTRNMYVFTIVARAHLKVNLWRLEALSPFVHIGIQSILLEISALALLPLQAVDLQFRLHNYLPGLLLGVPIAITLLILPIWGMHRRIVETKQAELERVQGMLEEKQGAGAPAYEAMVEINVLADYKARLKALPAWPVELPDVYRLGFYIIIPPVSWTGSALMQRLLVS
ncbi:MAG: hypothetical protein AAF512_21590 [Pseudomonadota bacterium]